MSEKNMTNKEAAQTVEQKPNAENVSMAGIEEIELPSQSSELDNSDTVEKTEGSETVFFTPIYVQLEEQKGKKDPSKKYDHFFICCRFDTGEKTVDGETDYFVVKFYAVPPQEITSLYELMRKIYGKEKKVPLYIVRTSYKDKKTKDEIVNYGMRVKRVIPGLGEIVCDLHPQSAGDRGHFKNLTSILKERKIIK